MMRWNLPLFAEGQRWRGLGFEVSGHSGRPPLRPEVVASGAWDSPGEVIIAQHEHVVMRSTLHEDSAGFGIERPSGMFQGVVEPIAAAKSREIDSANPSAWFQRWAHYFVDGLASSENGPIHNSTWALKPVAWVAKSPLAAVDLRGIGALRLTRQRVAFDELDVHWGSPGLSGNEHMILLRRLSPAEAGNVKAWRKLVIERLIPPVLVWWVGGLCAWIVIDGHDRLAACEAEGLFPPVLGLAQVKASQSQGQRLGEKREFLNSVAASEPTNSVLLDALANDLVRTDVLSSELLTTTAWVHRSKPTR